MNKFLNWYLDFRDSAAVKVKHSIVYFLEISTHEKWVKSSRFQKRLFWALYVLLNYEKTN